MDHPEDIESCLLKPMNTPIINADAHSTRLTKLDEICTRCERTHLKNACNTYDGACPYDALISVLDLGGQL